MSSPNEGNEALGRLLAGARDEGPPRTLEAYGSRAATGFAKPEGIVIFHAKAGVGLKKTLERDDEWKGKP